MIPRRRVLGTAALQRLALLCLLSSPAAAASTAEEATTGEPGSELTVYLMTVGAGDRVWERFGHNALWIANASTGSDVAYNWGLFHFDQVGFVPRFLRGTMLYRMAGLDAHWTVREAIEANRTVTLQELEMTPAQRLELQRFVHWNAQPENAAYTYDYFLDNCSTRVRDALDRALGGQLRHAFEAEVRGASFRHHTRRLTQMEPFLYTGMDALLGSRGDRPISVWEEMFVPMVVRDQIRSMTVQSPDGVSVPLVRSERVLYEARRPPDVTAPGNFVVRYLLIGLGLAAALLGLSRPASRERVPGRLRPLGFQVLARLWSLLVGALGTLLVAVLFTDHRFMFWNENLFFANPLSLLLAVAVFRTGGHAVSRFATGLSLVVAAIATVGFLLQALPGLDQSNGPLIALALPVHLALAVALRPSWRGTRTSGRGDALG